MTDTFPTTTAELVVHILFYGGLLYATYRLYRWWSAIPVRYPRAFNHAVTIPMKLPATPDPCDHSYKPMSLDNLYTHMFEHHFEVWNAIGDRNPPPKTWHTEHRRDHGQL